MMVIRHSRRGTFMDGQLMDTHMSVYRGRATRKKQIQAAYTSECREMDRDNNVKLLPIQQCINSAAY